MYIQALFRILSSVTAIIILSINSASLLENTNGYNEFSGPGGAAFINTNNNGNCTQFNLVSNFTSRDKANCVDGDPNTCIYCVSTGGSNYQLIVNSIIVMIWLNVVTIETFPNVLVKVLGSSAYEKLEISFIKLSSTGFSSIPMIISICGCSGYSVYLTIFMAISVGLVCLLSIITCCHIRDNGEEYHGDPTKALAIISIGCLVCLGFKIFAYVDAFSNFSNFKSNSLIIVDIIFSSMYFTINLFMNHSHKLKDYCV
jgi:hypothetical protein